ncbi:MAG: hypothetical protein ACREEV_05630, partial [Dongiaceae bacterium]
AFYRVGAWQASVGRRRFIPSAENRCDPEDISNIIPPAANVSNRATPRPESAESGKGQVVAKQSLFFDP